MSTLSTHQVLGLGDLVTVCRFMRDLRGVHSERGIEDALDRLYDWVHDRIAEGRISLVSILARTMNCRIESIDLAIGILSSSGPCCMSEALKDEWSSLWERTARVLAISGKDPERCMPIKI